MGEFKLFKKWQDYYCTPNIQQIAWVFPIGNKQPQLALADRGTRSATRMNNSAHGENIASDMIKIIAYMNVRESKHWFQLRLVTSEVSCLRISSKDWRVTEVTWELCGRAGQIGSDCTTEGCQFWQWEDCVKYTPCMFRIGQNGWRGALSN
jgi:hypothetical protein